MSELDDKIEECRREVDITLTNLRSDLDTLLTAIQSVEEIHKDVKEMRELLTVWNSAKGFVTVMQILGTFLRWVVYIGGTVGALWYFLKFGKMPPST